MPRKHRRSKKHSSHPIKQIENPSNELDELKIDPTQPSLLDLPNEITSHIFSFFNKAQLAKAGEISRSTYHHTRDSQLQRHAAWPMRDYQRVLPERMVQFSINHHSNGQNSCKHIRSLAQLSENRIISGSSDGAVRIWNTKTRQCEKIFLGHEGYVTFVARLSDTEIVSSCRNNEIRVWEISTSKCKKVIPTGCHMPICGIVLSPNEIMSGSFNQAYQSRNNTYGDSSLCIWNLESGESRKLEGHTSTVSCLVKSSDGTVISASWDKTIRIWDWENATCLKTLSCDAAIGSVAECRDGQIVGGGETGPNSTLYVWNRKAPGAKKFQTEIDHGTDPISNLICLPNDNILVVARHKAVIFDIKSDEPLNPTIRNVFKSDTHLESALLLHDGRVVTGTATGWIHIRDFAFVKPEINNELENVPNYLPRLG